MTPATCRGQILFVSSIWPVLAAWLIVFLEYTAGANPPPQTRAPSPAGPSRLDRDGDPLPPGALVRLGSLRFLHSSMICQLSFSRDGRTLASREIAGDLVLWQVPSGKRLATLKKARGFDLSPDGRLLAWGGEDSALHLCEAATGKETRRLAAGKVEGHAVAFHPNGRSLAWVGRDKAIHLTDLTSGEETRRLAHQDGDWSLHALGFTPDGKTLLAGRKQIMGSSQEMMLWDLTIGREVRRMKGCFESGIPPAVSPDGRLLACAAEDLGLRLWDLTTGKDIRQLGNAKLLATAFAPDGKTLAAATWDRSACVRLWDLATGKERWRSTVWADRAESTRALAFSPDSRTLAVGGENERVQLLDAATGAFLPGVSEPRASIISVASSPDGGTVATGGADGTILLWDAARATVRARLKGHRRQVACLAYSPDGKRLVSGSVDQTLRLWDAEGKEKHCYRVPKTVWWPSVAFSPEGKLLVWGISSGLRGERKLWLGEGETGQTRRWVRTVDWPFWQGTLAPGGRIVAKDRGESVELEDLATGRSLRQLGGTPRDGRRPLTEDVPFPCGIMDFSRDSKTLAWLDERYGVRLWEVSTGLERGWLQGPADGVGCVKFSTDGRWLATEERGGLVRLWSAATGKQVCQLAAAPASSAALSFSPDGRLLVTAGPGTALVWDMTRLVHPRREPGKLSAKEMSALWAELGDQDPGKAYRAIHALRAAGGAGVVELEARLRPAASPATPERIGRLLDDLDSRRFSVRQRAARELEKLGIWAEPLLRARLKPSPSLEYRRRAEELLRKLEQSEARGPRGELLRALHAVEVLEHVRTPRAEQLLRTLGKGRPESLLTREAKAALDRLHSDAAAAAEQKAGKEP